MRVAIAPIVITVVLLLAPPPRRLAARPKGRISASSQVTVGSKVFTESVILGEIATDLARSAGARATHKSQLNGTRVLWTALVDGEIDVYPEYTGTITEELLANKNLRADAQVRAALAERGVAMTRSLGFSDTYAVGMKEESAGRLGIASLSDLRGHPDLRFGFSNEFLDRRDGWPGLRDAYGLPQRNVTGLDHDLAYRALAAGSIDATDLYSTDAEIQYYNLRVLKDDRHYFPDYSAVYLYRLDLHRRAPKVADALEALEGRIDEPAMIRMNARAKLDHVPEAQVAADFLARTLDLQVEAPVKQGRLAAITRRVLDRTGEHLLLVGTSLAAAIAAGVPLGVIAFKRPRLGQVIIGAVAVIFTIPSLALLVFMIPLLGIGGWPAVVALFLYSLLPIVRNTHAGLRAIPGEMRESAEALGLPAPARMLRVELPMAAPAILAGVKTSAVVNVGTATLGALIGAGGYGQPILTGIRLDDTGLILQGAVPAAVLALLVSGAFDLLERTVVPRGLRMRGGKDL